MDRVTQYSSECCILDVGLSQVKEEELVEALTKRKTVTVNDKLILPYSHSEVCVNKGVSSYRENVASLLTTELTGLFLTLLKAITARDSMAKSLYSALFDWIVLRINHALLNKKDMEESVKVGYPSFGYGIVWNLLQS